MPTTLIEHNPLLKHSILQTLAVCEQHPNARREEIELLVDDAAFATAHRHSSTISQRGVPTAACRHTSTTILDMLVRDYAVEERLSVDGAFYEGTLLDLQVDPAIGDDSEVERYINITQKGKEVLDEYAGNKRLLALLERKPQYRSVYRTMLEFCDCPEGRTRSELERTLEALPELAPVPGTGERSVYPQYFIDSLEIADGICWQNAWRTTGTGKRCLDLTEGKARSADADIYREAVLSR